MENHTPQNNGDSDANKFVGAPRMSPMWSYPPRPYENYPHYRNHYPEPSPQQQQVNAQQQYQQLPQQQQFAQPQQFQQPQQQQLQQMQQQLQQIQQTQQIQPQQPSVQQIQHIQIQQPQQQLLQKLTPVQQQTQQPSIPQIQVVSAQTAVTTASQAQQQPQIVQQSSTIVTTTSEPAAMSTPVSTTSHVASINSSPAVGTTLQTVLTSGISQPQSSTKTATSQLMNSQQTIEQPTKMLTRNRLQDLVREVDPNEQLDEDVEDILLQIADDFVENAITNACLLAKHRKSNTVEVKDLQLHLERNWNMWIPGFGTDELRPYKKSSTTEAHKQRQTLIKKHTKKS